jgi:ankyrin repeat protein
VYRYLIETKGCDVNVQDKDKDTPLHNTLENFNPYAGGDITVLTYLLTQKGINGNIKGEYGYILLHKACDNINTLPLDIFKMLIETHGADVNVQNNIKDTPLHRAVRRFDPDVGGNITTLTYLLSQKDVNCNIKGSFGCTLLHTACEQINALPIDVFKLLIGTMVFDINAQDKYNDTPIHLALRNFNPTDGGDITILTYLLSQKDVNANIKGEYDNTLLHAACENINKLPIDVFKLLLEILGCDVNVQNNYKNTPLRRALACFKPHNGGDITIFAYLINENNANVNIKDQNDCTLLHLACIGNLSESKRSVELNAECDTILCQIVEFITERCVQDVFDEKRV